MTDDYNSYEEPKVYNHYTYGSEDDYLKLRGDSFRDRNLITTPGWIVKDMLDLLPDSVWNTETTFLIPCIKSGNFAIEVKNRLMKCEDAIKRFPSEKARRDHIDSKQLFCIYWYTEEEFDKNLISGHIWGINGFLESIYSQSINLMCTDDLNFDTFKDKTGKKQEKLLESIKEKFGTVKFDVVIGNPPYNNDLYIDFVQWGHQRANKYSLWITPAKWQAKGGDKNELFRQTIVPYMSKIVYYPCTGDIFDDVGEASGISYYILDKVKHDIHSVRINCKSNNTISSNFEEHNESKLMLCNKNVMKIINKCRTNKMMDSILNFKQSLYVSNMDNGNKNKTSSDDIEVMQAEKVVGYRKKSELFITANLEKYKCTTSIMAGNIYLADGKTYGVVPVNIIKPYQVNKGSYACLLTFDTIEQAESFKSYYMSKLFGFLFYFGACGTTLTGEFYRYIPYPGAFDHIFTDEELYAKYGLTQDEINIIKSVIKERK